MHTSYGIVTQLDPLKDGAAMITAYAHDVASDKWTTLTELVSLCNRLELSIANTKLAIKQKRAQHERS